MELFKLWPIVVALLLLADPLSAGKILGYFITPSRSHFIVHDSLMRGLAANGHEVYLIIILTNIFFNNVNIFIHFLIR